LKQFAVLLFAPWVAPFLPFKVASTQNNKVENLSVMKPIISSTSIRYFCTLAADRTLINASAIHNPGIQRIPVVLVKPAGPD
jgi:hypothetical protein